jgi:hypothetical protein
MFLPFAAFAPSSRLLDRDVEIVAESPKWDLRASTGGTKKSRELDPEPHLKSLSGYFNVKG